MEFSLMNTIFGSFFTASSNKLIAKPGPERQPESDGTEIGGFAVEGQGYRNVLSRMREKLVRPGSTAANAVDGKMSAPEAGI